MTDKNSLQERCDKIILTILHNAGMPFLETGTGATDIYALWLAHFAVKACTEVDNLLAEKAHLDAQEPASNRKPKELPANLAKLAERWQKRQQ